MTSASRTGRARTHRRPPGGHSTNSTSTVSIVARAYGWPRWERSSSDSGDFAARRHWLVIADLGRRWRSRSSCSPERAAVTRSTTSASRARNRRPRSTCSSRASHSSRVPSATVVFHARSGTLETPAAEAGDREERRRAEAAPPAAAGHRADPGTGWRDRDRRAAVPRPGPAARRRGVRRHRAGDGTQRGRPGCRRRVRWAARRLRRGAAQLGVGSDRPARSRS